MTPGPGRVFYPKYLDLPEEKNVFALRELELQAYSAIISAVRAQGDLTKEKRSLLHEIRTCLGITEDRHRAEVRCAVNDERLATIALFCSGYDTDTEWKWEGRRIVPLPHRRLQVTAHMEEADRAAEIIAKENAELPAPTKVPWSQFQKRPSEISDPPEKPAETKNKTHTRLQSLYCIKCLTELSEVADASTSTWNLYLHDKADNCESVQVPSASDSYVFLPSGTTVRVSGKSDKEENDAYSLKPNFAGNFDFGNAPEISLSGTKSTKRKRKRSIGSMPVQHDGVTIRQVIRPNAGPVEDLYSDKPNDNEVDTYNVISTAQKMTPSVMRTKAKRKHFEDNLFSGSSGEPLPVKAKRKKPVSHAITVQHTPVPPEHLYAVGVPKPKRNSYSEEDFFIQTGGKTTQPITKRSPTKNPYYPGDMSPLSPSYYPSQPSVLNQPSSASLGDIPAKHEESAKPYPSGFRYSPSKSFHSPSNFGQAVYRRSSRPGHMKRHRSSPVSLTKRVDQLDNEQRSILRGLAGKNEVSLSSSLPGTSQMGHKAFDAHSASGAFHTSVSQSFNTVVPPAASTEMGISSSNIPHSSSLEELASVSLMASALSTGTMVKTGLAPVSAIVSRVTSPAPGQISSTQAPENSHLQSVGLKHHKLDEGSIDIQSSYDEERFASSEKSVPTLTDVTRSKSNTVVHPISSLQIPHLLSSIDNPVASVPSALTHTNLSSSSVPHLPRVISTIAGKAHTLLKSSSGNVITVTANTLPGVKSGVSTIVSGASIMKPHIGQKASIIVVHKATGTKPGRTVAASFPTLGVDGSKVITVSTKNITGPSSYLPKIFNEAVDEGTSESALGSIQGLVSGLSSPGMLKKGKVVGVKPKFITMPLHKKPLSGKFGEPTKTKIIPNVVRAPGKVLVKASGSTLATAQLRTISTTPIVKPISQTSQGHDIVAAALNQSLGSSVVRPPPDIATLHTQETGNMIKVPTSTPAASTIKAFAATYQRNSSTGQQKQILTAHSPVMTISPSLHDKAKVVLSTSGHTQPMLFTPNQPQVHRSPQASSGVKSVLNPMKSIIRHSQPIQHQSVMQVKLVSHPISSTTAESALTSDETKTIATGTPLKGGDVSSPTVHPKSHANPPTGDRATYIYQYQPTARLSDKEGSTSTPAMPPNDVIMLHSVNSDIPAPESDSGRTEEKKPVGSGLVKITFSSVATTTVMSHSPSS